MIARKRAQHPRKNVVKKTGKKKRPEWDSTVNDLKVHQLSKAELELRRSRILSKNADKAKRDLEEIAKEAKRLSSAGSQRSSLAGKASNGNTQEKELHSVLEESDRAIAVVKDLFGDDPKRFTARPNVTVAPHVSMDKAALQRTLLESQVDGPTPSALHSPGGIRDDSVLGLIPAKPALNELPSPSSDIPIDESGVEDSSLLSPDQDSPSSNSIYRPVLVDIPRFQKLMEQHEESGDTREDGSPLINSGSQPTNGAIFSGGKAVHGLDADQLSTIPHSGTHQDVTVESNLTPDVETEGQGIGDKVAGSHTSPQPDHSQSKPMPHRQQQHPLQIVHKMPLKAAAGKESPHSHHTPASTAGQHVGNHSKEIYRNQRVRKLPPGNNKGAASSSKGIYDDLSVLQQLVQNLEQELQDYEHTSGYSYPVQKTATTKSGTFSSLTASLLASVTKLTHYLKQSEIQLKGEVAVRNQLLHAMAEQQNLMDALAADVVKLQEENSSLKSGFQQLEQRTTQQTKTFEEGMSELRVKLSSLEQSVSSPPITCTCYKEPTLTATSTAPPKLSSDPAVIPPPLPSTSATKCTHTFPSPSMPVSSHALISSLPQADDLLYNTTIPPQVNPSCVNEPAPGPRLLPHESGLLSGAHCTLSTTPFSLLAVSSHQPVPRQVVTHENPATSFYQTGVQLPSFLSPFFPAPTSLSTPLSEPAPGLSLAAISPSEFSASPPPISNALQVSSPQPLPSNSFPFQSTHSQPPLPPRSISTYQSVPPSTLPYSWKTPQRTSGLTAGGVQAVHTAPFVHTPYTASIPVSSAPTSLPPSNLSSQVPPTTLAVSLPNLSLNTASLPFSETSVNETTTSSSSSLDIEASLARMSSLARSVLEELAQDRGQLLKVCEPGRSYLTPKPLHTSAESSPLPPMSSASILTSVTSLESEGNELQSSSESTVVESSVLENDQSSKH